MRSLDLIRKEREHQEKKVAPKDSWIKDAARRICYQRNAETPLSDEDILAELIAQLPAASTSENEERLFTLEEVSQIVKARIVRDKDLRTPSEEDMRAAELEWKEIMLNFQKELQERYIPAELVMDYFASLDTSSLEGLIAATDDMLDLYELLKEHVDQVEIQQSVNKSNYDRGSILKKIFMLED